MAINTFPGAPSPDIIIVDEEPVQEKAIVQVIRAAPPVPSQPLRAQGNQVIVGTPQGVPYFLGQGNVPFQIIGTSPQGAPILARPVVNIFNPLDIKVDKKGVGNKTAFPVITSNILCYITW